MNYSIKHNPSYSLLDLELSSGESIQSEGGAMVYMSEGAKIETVLAGGFFTALVRKIFGGESMFYNVFTATGKSIKLGLAPDLAGDVTHVVLDDSKLIIQKGSYLCSETGVSLKTRWGGLKSLIGGEGVFLLEAGGKGVVFLNSYGAIMEVDIDGEYILDTGHMVAFEGTLNYEISKTGGWKSTLLSGEGFTMRFKGRGKLWVQTRVPKGLVNWLLRLLPR